MKNALLLLFFLVLALSGAGTVRGEEPAPLAAPRFTAAWGDRGGVPALAVITPQREATILTAGSPADARSLVKALQRQGIDTIDTLLMPTAAPFPRSADVLAQKMKVRRLAVLENPRTRTEWQELRQFLLSAGAAVDLYKMTGERSWRAELANAEVFYQQLDNGAFCAEMTSEGRVLLSCEHRATGEFVITAADGKELLRLPKTNRAGWASK